MWSMAANVTTATNHSGRVTLGQRISGHSRANWVDAVRVTCRRADVGPHFGDRMTLRFARLLEKQFQTSSRHPGTNYRRFTTALRRWPGLVP